MKNLKFILVLLIGIAAACGDPDVGINEVEYEQKIVVEGILNPGQPIQNIKLMRNFALGTNIDSSTFYLYPDANDVTASINGLGLQFDTETNTYFANTTVEYSQEYTLNVTATIDGKTLYCSSTTRTPGPGFAFQSKDLGTIIYRAQRPLIYFTASGNADTYAFSIRPNGASLDNFIYENPFIPNLERKDVEDNFDDFLYQLHVMINIDYTSGEVNEYEMSYLDTWFYTDYTVIGYAADKNFKDYILTANNVQEADGNFIEPQFHFEGDGIGVFGSAVTDTLVFSLVK